jgi:uncharacterized protein GlcG (DUF336 family)
MKKTLISFALMGSLAAVSSVALAGSDHSKPQNSCAGLPSHAALKNALTTIVTNARNKIDKAYNGGFDLDMWGTVVNRDGEVCAIAFTGAQRSDQWPGSRVISAQKANTANAFSLPHFALSTANLYNAVQPGGSLYGLQESNPVDTAAAYKGPSKDYGQPNDPLVGNKIGGVNVFGGGLALYNNLGQLVGAIGVSGDTSCADHNIAWRTRNALNLDYVPAGVNINDTTRPDNIISSSNHDWGHPSCPTTNLKQGPADHGSQDGFLNAITGSWLPVTK